MRNTGLVNLSLPFRERNEPELLGVAGRLKLTLSHLKCKRFDQGRLFTVIEAELTGGLVDEFELPGH